MKNKFGPFTHLLFGTFIVIGIFIAIMLFALLPFIRELGISPLDLYWPGFPPETVSSRSVLDTNHLELLWMKNINIDNPHKVNVELFMPNDESLVFWSPQAESLMSLEFRTGNVLWETAVPDVMQLGLYDDRFFIISYDWLDKLTSALNDTDGSFVDCSFAGQTSLLSIDAKTGSRIWGYSYWGADSFGMSISDQNIYVTGSADHGASRSVVRIDVANGSVLERDCFRWPDERELTKPPADESEYTSSDQVVLEEHRERDLGKQNIRLFFVAQESRLDILDGQSKEIIGSVNFKGAALNPWDIDVAVQGNIAVIYFGDSHQLFGFRLPDPNKD